MNPLDSIFKRAPTKIWGFAVAKRQPSFIKVFVLRCLKYFSANWLTGCLKIKAFMNAKPLPWQESAPLAHVFGLTGEEWSLTC